MTIMLNHAIVPARDKVAAAKFFAGIFGLKRGRSGHFAPVRVNPNLTLLFDDDDKFESHHYAFHVSNREFWPAPGSEDTELGVFMGPEVSHGETKIYAGVQA